MQQNKIEEIRKQILNKYNLRIGDRIKYDLLHSIYQGYVELFDEKTFAQEVLQISYGSYCQIKYDSNKRAILLKNQEVDIYSIREEILKNFSLRPGNKVNYEKLCEIAEQYEQIIDKRTVAYEVLGISKKMLYQIKNNPNYSTTILSHIFKQNMDNLKKEILKNEGIEPGDFINFKQLYEISKKYNIRDRDLAINILEIKLFNYYNIKRNSNRRTRILCDLIKKKEDKGSTELKELRNKIIGKENLIPGSKVNYEQLHKIYLNYSSLIDEVNFAVSILGVDKTRFFNLKSNRNDKAIILKDMIDVTVERIRKKIIEKEQLKPGDTIDYERLTILIETWKRAIDETILVRNVLCLSAEAVRNMKKNRKQKSIVMKDFIEEKSEEDIIALRNKLFEDKNLRPGVAINYETFLILFEKYKNDIDEKSFALRVLLIPKDKYLLIKRNSKKKTKICKELKEELSQNELDNIRKVVFEEYSIIEGEKINYERLAEIAERWKDKINEKDFAYKILGISEKSYYAMKYNAKKQAYVLNLEIKEKADKIRYRVSKDKRYYGIEEIKKICAESQLTIDQFCSYVVQREMHKKVYLERNFYSELLQNKGKIFIGRGERITEDFARKNQNLIIDIARSLAINLCKTYQAKQHIEDFAQDTMLYIIENCGDLEKNFSENFELCKGLIYTRAKTFIKGLIITGKKAKTISIDSYYKDRKDNSLSIKDKEENVENEVIDKIANEKDSEELVKQVLVYIENGANPIEVIRHIANRNGLEFQNLIEQFRKYYIKAKNINGQEVEQEK